MRDYATVAPQFWLGKTGRELRKKGAEAQVVSFYLMTSPHANMLGLYYLPILYIAHETGLGLEGASKGLRSQDQDQDQEQDKDSSGHGSATPPDHQTQDEGDKPDPQKIYPNDFEQVWSVYPKRAGGNSKSDAFKAWNARIRDGTTTAEIFAGVVRYAAFVKAEGILNTQYVKQAKTFFGPGMHFSEPWAIQQAPGARDPNQISEPDKTIPSGFRG